jgi:hypothetical protein
MRRRANSKGSARHVTHVSVKHNAPLVTAHVSCGRLATVAVLCVISQISQPKDRSGQPDTATTTHVTPTHTRYFSRTRKKNHETNTRISPLKRAPLVQGLHGWAGVRWVLPTAPTHGRSDRQRDRGAPGAMPAAPRVPPPTPPPPPRGGGGGGQGGWGAPV